MKIKSIVSRPSWKIFWLFIFLAVVSLFLSLPQERDSQERKTISVKGIPGVSKSPSPKKKASTSHPTSSKMKDAPPDTVIITTPAPTSSTNSNTSSSTSPTSEIQVSLSVNGSDNFSINLAAGSSQCDVLNKALTDGKIQSLNMRYNNSLGTYGVYQINGVGKDNAIWWTYTVNGQSPSQGCSYIKVNNGDRVEWKYIGS